MPDPLILYSTNSSLAYNISKKFYGDRHFVWCTPHFDGIPRGRAYTVPPSASPAEIYRTYARDIAARDAHSDKIKMNRLGIVRGARSVRLAGIISLSQQNEIIDIVKLSDISDFKPLIYVIPFDLTKRLVQSVPAAKRAHPLSAEYFIKSLPETLFDIITI